MSLAINNKNECRWDMISLGEVMLRFDPGDRRVATTRQFEVSEGGGEYNVARGLKRCFGMDTAIVTARSLWPLETAERLSAILGRFSPWGGRWLKFGQAIC